MCLKMTWHLQGQSIHNHFEGKVQSNQNVWIFQGWQIINADWKLNKTIYLYMISIAYDLGLVP